MNSLHKGQWRGALMFSLICTRINDWVNNGKAGDMRRHRAHYDVTVMYTFKIIARPPRANDKVWLLYRGCGSTWRCSSPPLHWRHNEHHSVSNHQPHDCSLNRLFRRRSKKTSKLRVTGLCAGNSPVSGEFPAQKASNAENVSIWWRHHALFLI